MTSLIYPLARKSTCPLGTCWDEDVFLASTGCAVKPEVRYRLQIVFHTMILAPSDQ